MFIFIPNSTNIFLTNITIIIIIIIIIMATTITTIIVIFFAGRSWPVQERSRPQREFPERVIFENYERIFIYLTNLRKLHWSGHISIFRHLWLLYYLSCLTKNIEQVIFDWGIIEPENLEEIPMELYYDLYSHLSSNINIQHCTKENSQTAISLGWLNDEDVVAISFPFTVKI